jgi:hypothetical protein
VIALVNTLAEFADAVAAARAMREAELRGAEAAVARAAAWGLAVAGGRVCGRAGGWVGCQ